MKNRYSFYQRVVVNTTVFVAVTALLFTYLFFSVKLKEQAVNAGYESARKSLSEIIDKNVCQYLQSSAVAYNELSVITRDKNGLVNSIEIDTQKLNIIKSDISVKINSELKTRGSVSVSVPLLNALNNDLLMGKGPGIKYKFPLYAHVVCDYKSVFKSVGINNTLHQIIITISTNYYLTLPRGKIKREYQTSFIMAQTVIVGKTPDNFTSVYDINGDTADNILDYGT